MKTGRHLVVLSVLIQAAFFTGVARAGTINDPDIIVNGQVDVIADNSHDNWFTFSLNNTGNLIVSVAMGGGWDQEDLWVYDSDFKLVRKFEDFYTGNTYLNAGDYIMQFAGGRSGTFTLTSTQLIPGSGMPSPDYLAGYNAGKQACIDAPASCGIEPGGDFYVIPFPVPAK